MRLLRHFWHRNTSDTRERRLVFKDTIDSGPESTLEKEKANERAKRRYLMATADHILKNEARNSTALRRVYENEEDRQVLIAALMYDYDAGTITVFDEGMMELLDKNELTEAELKKLQNLRNKLQADVAKFFRAVERYVEEKPGVEEEHSDTIASKIKLYREADGADGLRSTDNFTAAVEELKKIDREVKLRGIRQSAILDIAQLVIRATENPTTQDELLAQVDAFIKALKLTDDGRNKLEIPALHAAVNAAIGAGGAKIDTAKAKEVIKVITPLASMSTGLDTDVIRAAKFDAYRYLPGEYAREKIMQMDRMKDRERFFYKLAGANTEALVKDSQRTDGAIDFALMSAILHAQLQDDITDDTQFTKEKLAEVAAIKDNLDTDEIKKIVARTGMTEDDVKELAVKVLTDGYYSITGETTKGYLTDGNEMKILTYLYGTRVAKEINKEAEGDADKIKDLLGTKFKYTRMTGVAGPELKDLFQSEKLDKHLKDNGYDNPTFESIPDAMLRAGLTVDLAEHLRKVDFADIDADTVRALAKAGIESKKISNSSAKKIVDSLFTDPAKGLISKEKLIDIVGLLFVDHSAGKPIREEAEKKIKEMFMETGSEILEETDDNYVRIGTKNDKLIAAFEGDDKVVNDIVHTNLKSIADSGSLDDSVLDYFKGSVAKVYETAESGIGEWWKYIKNLRSKAWDPVMKERLVNMHTRQGALKRIHGKFHDILSKIDDAEGGDISGRIIDLWAMHRERETLRKTGETPIAADQTRQLSTAIGLKLEYYMRDLKELNPLLLGVRDPEIRKTAKLILLHTRDLDVVKKYLDEAAKGDKAAKAFINANPKLKNTIPVDLTQMKRVEQDEGRDVLSQAQNDLNVDMHRGALAALATKGYLEGPLHYSNWTVNPDESKAREQLDLILYDMIGPIGPAGRAKSIKQVLIDVFVTGTEQKYFIDSTGKEETMTKADANTYIALFQKVLEFKHMDRGTSDDLLDREKRYTEPLDLLRRGAESISDMLHSGDPVQQGIAIAMIFFGAKALWDGYNNGGISKMLVVGVPLMSGADIVVKDMTGQGVFERFGLTWMNDEDLGSSVQQFLREQGKKEIYSDVDAPAGFAALKAMRSVDMERLIAWREATRANKDNNADNLGVPPELREEAYNLAVFELGSLTLNNVAPDKYEELGLEFMYKTLEAFFQDIAERNGGGTVDDGMRITRERYVDFDAKELAATGFHRELKDYTDTYGKFKMVDVLVYERPTPAMKEHLLKNDSLLGWLIRKSKLTKEEVMLKIDQGVSLFNIFWGEAKREVPRFAEETFDASVDMWHGFYARMKAEGADAWEELSRDAKVAWATVFRTAKAFGLKAKEIGEDGIDWTYDAGSAVIEMTPAAARDLYISIHTLQGIGNVQSHFEKMVKAIFPGTLADLLVMEKEVKDEAEKVEKLADRTAWYERLTKQLEAAVEPVPTQQQVNGWIVWACTGTDMLGIPLAGDDVEAKITTFDGLDSYQKMAAYEHVKRRIYSHIIGERIAYLEDSSAVEEYPMAITAWSDPDTETGSELELTDGSYGHALNHSYGLGTLEFLGVETTLAGEINDMAETTDSGALRTVLNFLHWTIDWGTRDDAMEYVTGHPRDNAKLALNQISIFLHPFIEEALVEFDGDEEALNAYRAYLETIVTNALVEVALGGVEMQKQKGIATPAENLFVMTKARAQSALDYLKLLRGSSGKAEKVSGLNLAIFGSKGLTDVLKDVRADSEHMARITGRSVAEVEKEKEERKDSPLAPKTLSRADRAKLEKALEPDGPLTPDERKDLIDALGASDVDSAKRAEIRKRFKDDFDVAGAPDLGKAADRARDYDYLQGLGRPADKLAVKKRLAKHFGSIAYPRAIDELLELGKIRDSASTDGKNRLQEILNAGASNVLNKILPEIRKVPIANLKKHRDYKNWKNELTKLYAACSAPADHFADTVSDALEYVLYRGNVDAEEPWEGKKVSNMEKYKAYLKDYGERILKLDRELTPPSEWSYRHPGFYTDDIPLLGALTAHKGSQKRMNKNPWSIDEGYVDSISSRLEYETEVHEDLYTP